METPDSSVEFHSLPVDEMIQLCAARGLETNYMNLRDEDLPIFPKGALLGAIHLVILAAYKNFTQDPHASNWSIARLKALSSSIGITEGQSDHHADVCVSLFKSSSLVACHYEVLYRNSFC